MILIVNRWIANVAVETLEQHHWQILEFMEKNFNHSLQHVVLKTHSTVVQVHCLC
jgi:hypothetical protein